MKTKIIVFIFLYFFSLILIAQTKNKSWIDNWQKSTVSIGIIDTLKYEEKGKIKSKPFFNIKGTGVIFYVMINNMNIPCLITARHVLDFFNNNNLKKIRIRFPFFDDKNIFD